MLYELFGNPLKNKKRTQRKPMTWLDKEAKNSDNLLHQAKDLPLLQAAIITKRTGHRETEKKVSLMINF